MSRYQVEVRDGGWRRYSVRWPTGYWEGARTYGRRRFRTLAAAEAYRDKRIEAEERARAREWRPAS